MTQKLIFGRNFDLRQRKKPTFDFARLGLSLFADLNVILPDDCGLYDIEAKVDEKHKRIRLTTEFHSNQ
ncbi:hypothetical protein F8M41_015103 [Gigaspora margarita]|uniref:Uncharacterized protein n=1 Tax=Gigaspora margarita TaxID=4874 RepID=A0A8H4AR74_GIGMA|nr:hypothetical protein F8M41_015103 [Gigaspora margarita]